MHNWRLLLLAFLAAIHPIACFTERRLVDGREECCDQQPHPIRDNKLSYETSRFATSPSDDRRLSREIREDRRYEVRNDDSVLSRSLNDRRVSDYRFERDLTRSASQRSAARFVENREQYRRTRDRQVRDIPELTRNVEQRNREFVRDNRARATVRDTRREIARDEISRDRQNERNNRDTSRNPQYRDDRTVRDSRSRSMESRRETRDMREPTREIRNIQDTRETRRVLQRARVEVTPSEVSRDREDRRLERRVSLSRSVAGLERDSRERRSLDRVELINSFRRASSEPRFVRRSVERRTEENIRERRERHESRHRIINERQRPDMDRLSVSRRVERQLSFENERNSRDSRNALDTRDRRYARDSRREFRDVQRRVSNEERSSDIRQVESRRITRDVSRARTEIRRDTTRHAEFRDRRDTKLSPSTEMVRERAVTPVQNQRRMSRDVERRTIDTRFRLNTDSARNRELSMIREKTQFGNETSMNWQYLFYTMQGIYLCGVLMQLLTENKSEKKNRALSWLTSPPRNLIKLD